MIIFKAMKGGFRGSFLFNLLIVLALCVGLYFVFFATLGYITKHSSEVQVPQVTGIDLKAAQSKLHALGFEVEIDSAYDPTRKAFVVLSQQPETGATVKAGRTLFLTVNKAEPPMTPMPNLVNLSFRSAELILRSNKLLLGDTTYRPDIAKGAVLEQLFNGKVITPNTMIPQGSKISLVIGDGLGNTEFNVPDVIGMTYAEGLAFLSGNGLQYTVLFDADVTDTASAIIYNQTPSPLNDLSVPNRIREGDIVDVFVKQSPTQEEMDHNRNPGLQVNSADTSQ